ncbi:hypothetical protein HZC27_01810 [Candidatus Roizmanbacteria bacterium]|nr:hypothetical protein [Candidatus Roizmanbacteria bacterium]
MTTDNSKKETSSYSYEDPTSGANIFTGSITDPEEADKWDKAFFGGKLNLKKEMEEENRPKNFFEKYSIFFFLLGGMALIFILFYGMSAAAWKEGNCLLLVPYFSHSTNQTCSGLNSVFSNAIYLFIVFFIWVFFSSLRQPKKILDFMDNKTFNLLKKEFYETESSTLGEAQKKYSVENIPSDTPEYKQQFDKQTQYRNQLRGKSATELRAKYKLTIEEWKKFLGKAI